MSSSPATDYPVARARRPGRLAGMPLRARLIAAILALMGIVCAVIGVVTTVLMRQRLVGQLDVQLAAAADRSVHAGGRDDGGPGPGPEFPMAPGQGPGTLGAHVVAGVVNQSAVIDQSGGLHQISATQARTLVGVPADGRPYTVDLGQLGDYRVIAAIQRDGDVLVTGLPLADVQEAVATLVVVEVAVTLAGLLLAGAAGTAIVRLNLRPLRRVAATAGRVAELPLSRGEVDLSVRVPDGDADPRTEVGQVAAALNRLLGHVGDALAIRQASETRVRKFVADASHELRTPLAAIRGYAELARRSPEPVPADVARALARVESASARMTTLVDDLLLLARLDSGRPLAREQVDLSRLTVDVIADAHVAGPDHRWLLDLPDGPVCVPGDAARLHQVLANLLANARIHTPPGTRVTTGLRRNGDAAVLTVTDDGPGIPADLQPEIFERFSRADTSRFRAAGSTGLGLAIVAAVVEAHGGRVAVASHPGCTEVTVRLPAAVRAAAGDGTESTGDTQPAQGIG